MKNEQGIIHVCRIHSDGRGEMINPNEVQNTIRNKDQLLWIHMDSTHRESSLWLETYAKLDPIVIRAMLSRESETRPRIMVRDDGMMIILRAMNLSESAEPEDMISLRMWINSNTVITARERDIQAIEDIMVLIKEDQGPKCPTHFLTMVTNRLFARMEPFIDDLEAKISKAEDQIVIESELANVEDEAIVRKKTAIFTRNVVPQKHVLEQLLLADFCWVTDDHRGQINESLDRVTRYVEELSELRERAKIINEEINNAHARRLNEITYMFSIAATVFLPLSFLTGMMGINIGGMPGVDNSSAFWLFSGLCVLIVMIQVLVFKKKKWF